MATDDGNVFARCREFAATRTLARQFSDMLTNARVTSSGLAGQTEASVQEIRAFAAGLRKDWAVGTAGLTGSMGRVGACGDNAAMESVSPCCRRTSQTARDGLPARSCAWRSSPGSSGTYHRRRRQRRLGRLTPIEYETINRPHTPPEPLTAGVN